MASENIVCPQCKTVLKKTAQMYVLGEISQAGGSYIASGSSETVPCGVCRFQFRIQDIIEGKYDPAPPSMAGCFVLIVVAAAIAVLVGYCSK